MTCVLISALSAPSSAGGGNWLGSDGIYLVRQGFAGALAEAHGGLGHLLTPEYQ